MAGVPEYIEDYLRIIKEELKSCFGLTEEEAAKAVYKSAVRAILTGDNEEMRRYQMHKSLADTALDVYRQYKNIGTGVLVKNGEEEMERINILTTAEPIRDRHKEKVSLLRDIPLTEKKD